MLSSKENTLDQTKGFLKLALEMKSIKFDFGRIKLNTVCGRPLSTN